MTSALCTVSGCEEQQHSQGLCCQHFRRYIRYGTPYAGTPEYRFNQKIDKSGDCWIWTAFTDRDGYGRFRLGDRKVLAHRLAWEMKNGPIPDGRMIDHACGQPACVNPDHLRLATPKENAEHRTRNSRSNRSGVRGVYWHSKDKKWQARVKHHGVVIHLGQYDNLAKAEAAVAAKRAELYSFPDFRQETKSP